MAAHRGSPGLYKIKIKKMKLRNMCMVRDTLIQTEWQPREERSTLTNYTSDRGLTSKICKGLKKKKKLDIKKTIQF